MWKRHCFVYVSVLVMCASFISRKRAFAGPPPTIAIQGKLVGPDTQSISGLRDYRIRFFDAEVAGSQLGGDLNGSVVISDSGRFTIEIVPPGAALAAVETWYEIAVDSDVQADGVDNDDVFPDRVKLHSVPFALWSADSDALGGIPAADYATDAELASALANHTISLDEAYDDGGAGAGRTITADAGPVAIAGAGGLESLGPIKLVDALGGNTFASLGENGVGGGVLRTRDEANNQTAILGSVNIGGGGFLNLHMNQSIWAGVTVDGWDGNSGSILAYRPDGKGSKQTVRLDANEGDGGSILYMRDGTVTNTVTIDLDANGSGGGAGVILRNSEGVATMVFDADSNDDANITLNDGDGNLSLRFHADDFGGAGQLSMYDANGDETIEIIAAEGSSQGGQITVRNADGIGTIFIDGDFFGDGRITTQELQITGGSDLSEQFDVRAPAGKVEPGMVVSIDPKRPGKLIVSGRAYDRTVAGVVSGAGGLETGMIMGQADSEANGEHPVALTGRVYCWCDASNGPIEPGDLLTTAKTPGHAMKVTDYAKGQGAILGKAMTSLAKGKGLVLVLVSLQ